MSLRLLWAMPSLVTAIFGGCLLLPSGATLAAAPSTQPVVVARAEQFDVTSAQGRPYRVWIAYPRDERPSDGYGTLYVLDANAMFLTAVDAVRFQHGLRPTIVVGVGYPSDGPPEQRRRYWDFTPVTPPDHLLRGTNEPPVPPGGTGGQEEFLAFLQDVVKPAVAARTKVDPAHQAIFGHSLAGRFVLHAMFTHPDSFDTYLAASPSIWWDNRSVLAEAERFVRGCSADAGRTRPLSLLLTVGEMEQKPAPGTPPARVEFLTRASMVDNASSLAEQLQSLKNAGLRVSFTMYPDENHGSVVPMALSRAVRFALTSPLRPTTGPSAVR